MNRRSLLSLLSLLCATLAAHAGPAPEHLRLFLLIGQSNMSGRGKIGPQDVETNPRIFMLTKDLKWTLAKDPVHFEKPEVDGVGLGSEFARAVLKANPKAKIGLIPAAVGGSSLAKWKPGSENYHTAVERARAALKSGTLACILWHQGEADSTPEKIAVYGEQFAAMIAQLRKDLDAPNVPVIVGELGYFREDNGSEQFNRALPRIAAGVPRCDFVTAEELTDRGDKVHFNSPSLRILGQRYAESYLRMDPPKEDDKGSR